MRSRTSSHICCHADAPCHTQKKTEHVQKHTSYEDVDSSIIIVIIIACKQSHKQKNNNKIASNTHTHTNTADVETNTWHLKISQKTNHRNNKPVHIAVWIIGIFFGLVPRAVTSVCVPYTTNNHTPTQTFTARKQSMAHDRALTVKLREQLQQQPRAESACRTPPPPKSEESGPRSTLTHSGRKHKRAHRQRERETSVDHLNGVFNLYDKTKYTTKQNKKSVFTLFIMERSNCIAICSEHILINWPQIE